MSHYKNRARQMALMLLIGSVLLAVGVCLLFALLSVITAMWPAAASAALRYNLSTEACIGTRIAPPPETGIGWYPPMIAYSSASPPPFYWSRHQSRTACARLFWLPFLPRYGHITVPF